MLDGQGRMAFAEYRQRAGDGDVRILTSTRGTGFVVVWVNGDFNTEGAVTVVDGPAAVAGVPAVRGAGHRRFPRIPRDRQGATGGGDHSAVPGA